jgi:hypothetical protein
MLSTALATATARLGSELTVVFPYHPLLSSAPADAVEERIREEVGALTADIEAAPVPTYRWTRASWPIHGLHEMARYEEAQLIVYGSAREGLADHLHVSLMERLVYGAPCAVAIAPAHYTERERYPLVRVGVGFSNSEEGISAMHIARVAGVGLRVHEPLHPPAALDRPLMPCGRSRMPSGLWGGSISA